MLPMNDRAEKLGYDPSDPSSFPYQADDPPFNTHRLVLEDPERAARVDPMETLWSLACTYGDDGPSEYRTLDMACRLFAALVKDTDNPYDGIPMADLFAAALDQALVWERG